jgi:hypothetical protein
MNIPAAAIAAWLEQQIAGGCTRVELWHLVTPQCRIAAYDVAGGGGHQTASMATEIARLATAARLPESAGHALFAYADQGVRDEAIGLALVREGHFIQADAEAPSVADRVLGALLRESEMCARLMRLAETSGVPAAAPKRQARRRNWRT